MQTLKVSSKSNATQVAGAISNIVRLEQAVEIIAVGAGAVNQTVKAIAIARGYVAPTGKDLICIPGFSDVIIAEETKSAIVFIVKVTK